MVRRYRNSGKIIPVSDIGSRKTRWVSVDRVEEDNKERIVEQTHSMKENFDRKRRVESLFSTGDRFIFDCPANKFEFAGKFGIYLGVVQQGTHFLVKVKWDNYKGKTLVRLHQFEQWAKGIK